MAGSHYVKDLTRFCIQMWFFMYYKGTYKSMHYI